MECVLILHCHPVHTGKIDERLKELDSKALLTAYMDDVMLCIDASKLAQALAIATEE